jgi:Inner membrane component of T3SS, cytoplasmic domain/Inner membrane component of T3SS, periplasmic domain
MTLQSNALEAKPQLEVTGGFHNGVKLALDEGTYAIGSTAGADIVLRDAGVASEHALLRIEGGAVRIEAMGGDLGVGDELVTQGHGCKLRMPVDIALGEARLRLSHPGAAEAGLLAGKFQPVGQFFARRPMMAAGGVICVALAVSVATHESPTPLKATEAAPEAKLALTKTAYYSDVEQLGKFGGKAEQAAAQHSSVEEAATQLMAKLKSMNIQSLRVTTGDKRVAVGGSLTKREAAAWTSVQQWFDETYGGRVVLTATVAVGESKSAPSLRLQAVWFGERPYVITEEGAHFYEGALLDNGWILQRIAEDRIVLEREGEALALTYR